MTVSKVSVLDVGVSIRETVSAVTISSLESLF